MTKFTPTAEQQRCIETAATVDMLKIDAYAGATKTSTLVMIAETIIERSLYMAFNKVTADEATERFPKHVTCKTTHGIAYSVFGRDISHKLSRPRGGGYTNVAGTGSEIAKKYSITAMYYGTQDNRKIFPAAYLGNLVKRTVARFESSADNTLNVKHVPKSEVINKIQAVGGSTDASSIFSEVLAGAVKLWADRINPRSEILATHDTYLKLFQLSKPQLGFDTVYLDEAQDTTDCVLDIFLNQKETRKILVGDKRQAIYAWRGATNAMAKVDCTNLLLSKSFRYGQAVADVAIAILGDGVSIIGNEKINSVVGMAPDTVDKTKPYARLFRTNSELLFSAVEAIEAGLQIKIEIDHRDFVKVLQSAVALYNFDSKNVKHETIVPYQTWKDLKEEAKHENELRRIAKIVEDGVAEKTIRVLEEYERTSGHSKHYQVVFTTAHKSKGREFEQVIVENDFPSPYKDGEWVGLTEEEENLLYVACTRAILRLQYNTTVVDYLMYRASIEGEMKWN